MTECNLFWINSSTIQYGIDKTTNEKDNQNLISITHVNIGHIITI